MLVLRGLNKSFQGDESIPSFCSLSRYFNASIVSLYIEANLARFRACVRVALKMRVSFSFSLARH